MVSFLKSMDNKTWKAHIKGWTPPMFSVEDGTQSLKLEENWTKVKMKNPMEFLVL